MTAGEPARAMVARWTDHLRPGEVYGEGPHTAATVDELKRAFPNRPHPHDPLRAPDPADDRAVAQG